MFAKSESSQASGYSGDISSRAKFGSSKDIFFGQNPIIFLIPVILIALYYLKKGT